MTAKRRDQIKNDESLLLPWFLTKRATMAIRSNVPRHYPIRMRNYCDEYGCLRCNTHRGQHQGNGLCHRCSGLILARLKRGYERRERPKLSHYAKDLLNQAHDAEMLLKDLSHWKGAAPLPSRIKTSRSQNPALEAFSAQRIEGSDRWGCRRIGSDVQFRNPPA
jgi:hypothetical protein